MAKKKRVTKASDGCIGSDNKAVAEAGVNSRALDDTLKSSADAIGLMTDFLEMSNHISVAVCKRVVHMIQTNGVDVAMGELQRAIKVAKK